MMGRIRRDKVKVRRDLIVNLKNGSAVRGSIWRWSDGVIELKGAQHYTPRESPKPVDGSVIVFESDVDFIQDPKG